MHSTHFTYLEIYQEVCILPRRCKVLTYCPIHPRDLLQDNAS